MKRRIVFLVGLVAWVLLGKVIAQSQNHGDLAVNQCVEKTLPENLRKQFAMTIEQNLRTPPQFANAE